jgi:creatinine amidohydrolase
MIVVSSNWFALGLPAGMFGADELKHGIHGGDLETSMMLALAPEQVNMSEAQHFHSLTEELARDNRLLSLAPGGQLSWQIQDLNPLGACGDASQASAEKGAQVLEFVARRFID